MENMRDILVTKGINAKGFGTIPKLIMTDKNLTIKAKAIYAYFCSYAGGGKLAFPAVEKIQSDLNIGDKAFYKHFKYLKAYGCIEVEKRERQKGHFASNIYILTNQLAPKKELIAEIEYEINNDVLIVDEIYSKGFGTIAKLVMLDKRLTIQSKAIYSYFCSYAGGGSQPFPSVTRIISDLGISEETYYNHFKTLKTNGYISVEQRKNDKGKFLSNIYTLNSYPITASENICKNIYTENNKSQENASCKNNQKPYSQNPRMEGQEKEPYSQNWGTVENYDKPHSQNQCSEKDNTNNNNNSFNINRSLTTTEIINNNIAQEQNPALVVVLHDEINIDELKKEVDKTIGGNVNLKMIHKLVNNHGIEKLRHCLYNWFRIIGTQKIESVESFFVKAVEEGYQPQTNRQAMSINGSSNRLNFKQREYEDEYFNNFFTNTNGNVYRGTYNERYIRDISKKIRANLRFKIEQGEYIGNAPYGYVKSANEKNRLIVDIRTAPVVKEIFSLYKKGYGYSAISDMLNKQGYPSPSSKNSEIPITPWNPVAVQRILCNRVYIGDTVQGVSEKISFKNKKTRRLPFDRWVITTNTHESIISNADFEEVQKIRARKRSNQGYNRNITHLLSNMLYCGKCGKAMYVRVRKDRPVGYICSSYSKNGSEACSSHYVTEQSIIDVITKELLEMLSNRELIDSFFSSYKEQSEEEEKRRENVRKLEQQILMKQKQQEILYCDRLEMKISEQLFARMNQSLEGRLNLLKQQLENLKGEAAEEADKMKVIDNFINRIKNSGINKNMIELMVNRIIVYDGTDSPEALELLMNKEEESKSGLIVVEYNYNNWLEI